MKAEIKSASKNVKADSESASKNVKAVLTYDANCIKMSKRSNKNEKKNLSKVNRMER